MSKIVYTEVLKTGDFEAILAEEFETTKTDAKEILRTFVGAVKRALHDEQKGVRLGDLGTMKVRIVPERDHRVPSTGETMTKPEHYGVKFDVNARFKKELEELPIE